jgi:hypothetical protein
MPRASFIGACHHHLSRVLAVITNPNVAEKILRPLSLSHDPAGLPPPNHSGPCTYEPWEDVDPTPDYENILTD